MYGWCKPGVQIKDTTLDNIRIVNDSLHSKPYLQYIFSSLAIVLGATVIFGWYTHNQLLVQVIPTYAPMQYNTALCLLLSGLAILLIRKVAIVAAIFGLVTFLIGGLTLIQYIFNINIGLDQLFMEHYIDVATSHLGRMAPNTALCYTLLGAAICLFSLLKRSQLAINTALVFVAIILPLTITPLIGYVSKIPFAYGWSQFTRMAVHTAFGFIFCVIAYLPLLWQKSKITKINRNISIPIAVGAIGIFVFLLLWQALISQGDKNINKVVSYEAGFVKSNFSAVIVANIQALERIYDREHFSSFQNDNALELDVKNYYKHMKSLEYIRFSKPYLRGLDYQNSHTSEKYSDQLHYKCEQQFSNSQITSKHNKIQLAAINNYLCVLYKPNNSIAILKLSTILKESLADLLEYNYIVSISANGKNVITYPKEQTNVLKSYHAKKTLTLYGLTLNINVWPQKTLFNTLNIQSPIVLMIFVLLIVIFAVLALRFWQISKASNASLIETINKQVKSQDLLRTVVETPLNGIMIVNSKGKVIFINTFCTELWGYDHEQLLSMTVEQLMPKEYRKNHVNLRENYMKDPHTRFMGVGTEIHILDKSNNTIPVEIALKPIVIDSEPCVLCTIANISERLAARKQLQEYADELKKSNNELDDFAYIVSHDLKEPIRGISNFSTFLLEDYKDKIEDEGVKQIETIVKLCKRMQSLIDTVLNYSRVGRVDFGIKPCDINEVIQHKQEFLDAFLKQNHADIIIPDKLPTIECDETRIGELFQNLITNGIKYNKSDKKTITVTCQEKDNEYIFAVADNGIGIDEKNFDKVFGMFKRLNARDEYGEGTGAGMTIAKKIAERHGGTIWLESKLGEGTTFFFSINKNAKPNKEKLDDDSEKSD